MTRVRHLFAASDLREVAVREACGAGQFGQRPFSNGWKNLPFERSW